MVKGEDKPAGKKETKRIRAEEKRINENNKDQPKGKYQKGKRG